MTIGAYDPAKFCLQTKVLERQSCELAISKAKEFAKEDKTKRKIHAISNRICNDAFNNFKTNIEANFPYNNYNNLIALTLKSRENLFFIDLKERIISILRNPD